MSLRSISALAMLFHLIGEPARCEAQAAAPHDPAGESSTAIAATTVEDVMHNRRPASHVNDGLARWFDVATAALAARYQLLVPVEGTPRTSRLQSTLALRGRFKADARGRYALHAVLATGQGFRGGWNATGIGSGGPTYDLFVKELFVSARPLPALELQAGGLHFLRGQSTEATSYDNDGHIVGERLTVRHAALRLFDELSVTRAFLGDLNESSVFARLNGISRANYYQALALKRVSRRAALSVDYTAHAGSDVIRVATIFDLQQAAVVDRVRFENYARIDPSPAYGYGLTVQRGFGHGITSGGGFSDIDEQYGTFNSDLNGVGRRVFGSMSVRLGAAWIASVQLAHAVGNRTIVGPWTRVDVALGYDVIRAVKSN